MLNGLNNLVRFLGWFGDEPSPNSKDLVLCLNDHILTGDLELGQLLLDWILELHVQRLLNLRGFLDLQLFDVNLVVIVFVA
jgi:hypothetical protein